MTAQEWEWERPDTFPARLEFLRDSFGLSANAAGLACGFTGQTWMNYERDDKKRRDIGIVNAIVRRFEVRPDKQSILRDWLLDGGPLPERPQPPFPFVPRSSKTPPVTKPSRSVTNRKPRKRELSRPGKADLRERPVAA